MNEFDYVVLIDGVIKGTFMQSEDAAIFLSALFSKYYADPELSITITRRVKMP